ncbi:MAG: flippase [Methanobrevibacter sp.]|jgi:O-antigen/teichoic acid export membrane protein|nr:flippase [Candidatus Methanoflexus mossambicus]
MSFVKAIFKNSSWLLISQLTTSVLGYFWIILIARYLGVGDFGIVNFGLSFVGIMSIFMDIGISTYIVREISQHPENLSKLIGNAIPLKIILSLFSLMITILVLFILNKDYVTMEVCLIFILQSIIGSFSGLFSGVFQAFGKMKYTAISGIINSVLLLISVISAIYLNAGIFGVVVSYLIAVVVSSSYIFTQMRVKIAKPKIQINPKFWKFLIISSVGFGLTAAFSTIYFMIDGVMLFSIMGDTANGIYSAAYKILGVLTTIYAVYTTVFYPYMSKFYAESKSLLKISYYKSIKYLLLITIPIIVGIVFYSKPIVGLIYGSGYNETALALNVLIWNVIFVFINGSSTTLLNSSYNEMNVMKINCIACIVNVVLNLILIPKYSYVGASLATIVTGCVLSILLAFLINKKLFKLEFSIFKDISKIIVSTIVLAIVLYFANLNIWIAIPVGIIVYFAMIFILKTFDKDDIYILKEVLGKNN